MNNYRGQSERSAMSGATPGDGATPQKGSECQNLVDALYAYMDGECDERLRLELRRHVDECPACLRALGIEQQVRQLVQRSCSCQPAPEELRNRISAQLRVRRVTYEVRQRREQF